MHALLPSPFPFLHPVILWWSELGACSQLGEFLAHLPITYSTLEEDYDTTKVFSSILPH